MKKSRIGSQFSQDLMIIFLLIFHMVLGGIDCSVYKKGFKCQSSTQIATNIPNPNQCFLLAFQNQNCKSFSQIELDRNGNCWCATNCEEGHGSYYNVFSCTETSVSKSWCENVVYENTRCTLIGKECWCYVINSPGYQACGYEEGNDYGPYYSNALSKTTSSIVIIQRMGYFSISLPIFCPTDCGTNLCHSQDGWCCVGAAQSKCDNDQSRWKKTTNDEDQELVRCTSYEVFDCHDIIITSPKPFKEMKLSWKIDDYPACHSKNYSGPNGEKSNKMTCCLTSGVHQLHCGGSLQKHQHHHGDVEYIEINGSKYCEKSGTASITIPRPTTSSSSSPPPPSITTNSSTSVDKNQRITSTSTKITTTTTTTTTKNPTFEPTNKPTSQPTIPPTFQPTLKPTLQPTNEPTAQPTKTPSEPTTDISTLYPNNNNNNNNHVYSPFETPIVTPNPNSHILPVMFSTSSVETLINGSLARSDTDVIPIEKFQFSMIIFGVGGICFLCAYCIMYQIIKRNHFKECRSLNGLVETFRAASTKIEPQMVPEPIEFREPLVAFLPVTYSQDRSRSRTSGFYLEPCGGSPFSRSVGGDMLPPLANVRRIPTWPSPQSQETDI